LKGRGDILLIIVQVFLHNPRGMVNICAISYRHPRIVGSNLNLIGRTSVQCLEL